MEAIGQSTQLDLGHWLLRLVALVIDSIILGIVAYILLWVLLVPLLFTSFAFGFFAIWGTWLILPLVLGLLSVLYFLVLEVSWGGTIGKRVLGLRVQTVNGGKINYSQSFIRNISKIFWVFLLLDWIVGIATPGDKRQKYSDRMAGTIVVQASHVAASVSPAPAQAPSQ